MDDVRFFALAAKLTELGNQYTQNILKHYQYATEYDKTLEAYKVSKRELVAEIERRNAPGYQSEPQKIVHAAKPVPKRR